MALKLGVFDNGTWKNHSEFAKAGKLETLVTTGIRAYTDPYVLYKGLAGKKGDAFILDGGDAAPWAVRSIYHGTGVAGLVGALRNGAGMHGVAFDAAIVAANNGGPGPEDGIVEGNDENMYRAGFEALAKAGVRGIVNSWGVGYDEKAIGVILPPPLYNAGSTPYKLVDSISQYYSNPGHGTYAAAEAVAKAGILQVFAAGNDKKSVPDSIPGLPYFRPEIERHWVSVLALDAKKQLPYYTSYCGYTKWYCVSAPGHNTNTASFEGEGLNKKESYLNFTGTSAAAPHVLGALGLVMQRYPYLSNAQVRDVLLTTSSHMGKTSEGVPDDVYGWGLIDLKKAMSGPGQFLSRFNANLGEGVADTWVNDISQVALDQRQSDEAVEVAAWKQRKAERGWDKGFGDVERENVRIDIANQYSDAAWAAADALLVKLFKVADTGTAIDQEEAAVAADPLASIVKARFEKKYPEWRERGSWGGFAKIWYADFKKTTIGSFEKFRQDIVKEAVVAAEREFASTETRTAYLAAKTYEAGLTKSGPGTLTLGGKNTWRGDTIVDGGELAIAEGGSIISSAIVNDSGLFTVDGSSADVNVNKGGALRVGESGKTLGLFVDGGTARIDGFSDMASVNAGGVLSGTGKLGNLDMREGGHVAPGHSIGTLTVTGDATFAKGSFYDVEIAPDLDKAGELKSDLLSVDGEAELLGGIVSVSLENEKTLMSKEQVENHFLRKGVILTATKGVSGQFERVLPEYSYIIGLLDYSDAGKVSLGFDLTDVEKAKIADKLKADIVAAQNEAKRLQAEGLAADKLAADKAAADLLAAQDGAKRLQIEMLKQAVAGLTIENADKATHNQKAVFDAVKALGYGNALTNTIFLKERGEVLPYDNLSGEAHATLSGALAKDASVIGNAAQNRIRAAFDGVTVKEQAVIASPLTYAPAQRAKTSDAFASVIPAPATAALWGEAYGGWAHAGGDGNAAGYSRNIGGFVTGLDGVVAETWRMGVLAGYGNTSLDSGASNASFNSYSVGLYGGAAWDNLTLSLGTALTQNEIDTDRTAVFGNLLNRHSASYDAETVQVFGELGYSVKTGYAKFEPFAAASYVHLKTDSFLESGTVSNLTGLGGTSDLTTTTLGLRASRSFALSDTISLTARGLLDWSHAFGDVTPAAKLAFAGGQPFDVKGLPVAQDMGIVEAGFDVGFGKATTLGLTYSGQFSDSARDNAVKADLTVRF